MAARFWVGGTGTWDNAATTHWSASTGGANGSSAPTTGDSVTFDASSGGGTVTVSNNNLSLLNLTTSLFTGTIDWSANNNNFTITGNWANTGSGTRTINLGSGTFTFSQTTGAGGSITPFSQTGATNLTFNANTSTLKYTGSSAGQRSFGGGGFTYNNVTFDSNAGGGGTTMGGSNTITTLVINGPQYVQPAQSTTQTVTTLSVTGSSGSPATIVSQNSGTRATISVASGTQTMTWAALQAMAFTGGATFAATSSFDLGCNTGVTITAPSGGGGASAGVVGG